MNIHNQNRHWLALVGLMASFLWTAQITVDWRSQLDDTGYAQRGDIGINQVIETERGTTGREFNPEKRPESSAIAPHNGSVTARIVRSGVHPGSPAVAAGVQPFALPVIRAPPQFITST